MIVIKKKSDKKSKKNRKERKEVTWRMKYLWTWSKFLCPPSFFSCPSSLLKKKWKTQSGRKEFSWIHGNLKNIKLLCPFTNALNWRSYKFFKMSRSWMIKFWLRFIRTPVRCKSDFRLCLMRGELIFTLRNKICIYSWREFAKVRDIHKKSINKNVLNSIQRRDIYY
jgi:hypothetical protein